MDATQYKNFIESLKHLTSIRLDIVFEVRGESGQSQISWRKTFRPNETLQVDSVSRPDASRLDEADFVMSILSSAVRCRLRDADSIISSQMPTPVESTPKANSVSKVISACRL
ncbi:hypothetical protein CR513_59517, partial [Mucuna pruriens]